MARLPRYVLPGQAQHIIQRGNNRQAIFADDNDYAVFLRELRDASSSYGLAIHAYVLMTNHIHLLATPEHETSIAKTLQSLGRRYVHYFNHTYGRTGTLWEGRYRSTVIDSERYLLTCSRYIELNPVRASMVKDPGQYRWSSYQHNALGNDNDLITSHPLYRSLGKDADVRRTAYRTLFQSAADNDDIAAIREATHKGWALGNDRFRSDIERLTQRRTAPLPRGRKPADTDERLPGEPNGGCPHIPQPPYPRTPYPRSAEQHSYQEVERLRI